MTRVPYRTHWLASGVDVDGTCSWLVLERGRGEDIIRGHRRPLFGGGVEVSSFGMTHPSSRGDGKRRVTTTSVGMIRSFSFSSDNGCAHDRFHRDATADQPCRPPLSGGKLRRRDTEGASSVLSPRVLSIAPSGAHRTLPRDAACAHIRMRRVATVATNSRDECFGIRFARQAKARHTSLRWDVSDNRPSRTVSRWS